MHGVTIKILRVSYPGYTDLFITINTCYTTRVKLFCLPRAFRLSRRHSALLYCLIQQLAMLKGNSFMNFTSFHTTSHKHCLTP